METPNIIGSDTIISDLGVTEIMRKLEAKSKTIPTNSHLSSIAFRNLSVSIHLFEGK